MEELFLRSNKKTATGGFFMMEMEELVVHMVLFLKLVHLGGQERVRYIPLCYIGSKVV
jgi:hypothetical protein